MSELFETIVADASAFDEVNAKSGSELSSLIRSSQQLSTQIKEAEQHLKDLKAMQNKVDTESIPAVMHEMGVDSVTVDGNKVELKAFVHASIPQDKRDEVFGWLRSIGEGDIIKNDVTCSFGKGEDNMAGDVVGMLEERGFYPKTKTHVHSSTLKAFVKGLVEGGKPVDLELFGAYVNNAAEIRRK